MGSEPVVQGGSPISTTSLSESPLTLITIMPAVSAPAKALVTGANGYIAVWVVRKLLEDGYTVVGTVRSASKGEHLKNLFAEYGDNFEVAVVPDITAVRARAASMCSQNANAAIGWRIR